jgi:hypothetical protein
MINLAQHLNLFYQNLGEPNTNKFPISLLKEWFKECEDEVNNISKCVYKEHIINSVGNTQEYTLPTDLMNYDIIDIYYSTTTSDEREKLVYIDINELDDAVIDWKEQTGDPYNWYVNKESGTFGFFPYEQAVVSGTNCIRVVYRADVSKMLHFYTTGTVSIVNGATAVTGVSTAFTGNVSAGDYIGIGKLLDSTHVLEFPTTWHEIASVDGAGALTLETAFSEASVSGVSYIITSPSSIVQDKLNLCTINFAMAKAKFKDREYDLSEVLSQKTTNKCNEYKRSLNIPEVVNRRAGFKKGDLPSGRQRFFNDYDPNI